MKLDELFGIGKTNKKEQELKQLALKVKGMYNKALNNYEQIESNNAEAFDQAPLKAFAQWYEHMFDKELTRAIGIKSIRVTDQNIKQLTKALIALGSLNYYLRPKTPFAAASTLVDIAPMVDKTIVKPIEQTFGKFVNQQGGNVIDPTAKPAVGLEYETPQGTFIFRGQMWTNEKGQPAPKEIQAALTQKARDEGNIQ
jgi:hypothetical protein